MRRKALLISSNFEPELIGIARYSSDLVSLLDLNDFQVDVLTAYPSYGILADNHDNAGLFSSLIPTLNVHRVNSRKYGSGKLFWMLIGEISFLWSGLWNLLRFSGSDKEIAIAIMPRVASGYLGLVCKAIHKKPLILILQDISSAATQEIGLGGGKIFGQILAWLEKIPLACADKVVVISEQMAEYLTQVFRIPTENVVVIKNYHIGNVIKSKKQFQSTGSFRITYTGNIGRKQDFESLFKAAELLKAEKDIQFQIYGFGNNFEIIRERSLKLQNVVVSGLVEDTDYLNTLNQSDVLFVTEKSSLRNMSLPSKLTAYFASGKPVIVNVSKESATAHFVGDAAIIIEPGDGYQLKEVILELRRNVKLYEQLSERSFDFFLQYLQRSDAWIKYTSLFELLRPRT
jgi:glycosyltransferase involved in cell wall biosynthesis